MDIVEVPLDAPAEEAPSTPTAPAAEPAAAPAPEAKRGRGRPKGAANKPKPARREPTPEPVPLSPPKATAKRKPAAQKAPKKKVVHESSESEDAPDAGNNLPQIAAEVLELLSLQRANQRAQRRDRYAAWFR